MLLLRKYADSLVLPYRPYDPLSVMSYPIPEELTRGGFTTPRNGALSDGDKAFIQVLYPR